MKPKPPRRRLIVLAGGNGAGKSTFYRLFLKPQQIPFINADEIARQLWPHDPEGHSYEAMELATEARRDAMAYGRSFCFETVFSHESKVEFLREAKQQGYEIHLYIIHLQHPDLNVGRVEQRVSEGGHNVPDEKIRSRLPRTLENLRKAAKYVDEIILLDNSRHDEPYQVQARFTRGRWSSEIATAQWAIDFVASVHKEARREQ